MVEQKYLCNVCHDSFATNDAKIVGFNWSSRNMVMQDAAHVENHVCINCLEQLIRIGKAASENGHAVKLDLPAAAVGGVR